MTTSVDAFVTVNGLRFHYLDWPSKEKTPLICLHGLTGHAHAFDDFGAAMAQFYRVIAWDQRGHGDTVAAHGDRNAAAVVDHDGHAAGDEPVVDTVVGVSVIVSRRRDVVLRKQPVESKPIYAVLRMLD